MEQVHRCSNLLFNICRHAGTDSFRPVLVNKMMWTQYYVLIQTCWKLLGRRTNFKAPASILERRKIKSYSRHYIRGMFLTFLPMKQNSQQTLHSRRQVLSTERPARKNKKIQSKIKQTRYRPGILVSESNSCKYSSQTQAYCPLKLSGSWRTEPEKPEC